MVRARIRVPRTTGSPLITVGSVTTSLLIVALRFGAAIAASAVPFNIGLQPARRNNALTAVYGLFRTALWRAELVRRFSGRLGLLQVLPRGGAFVAQVGEQDVGELAAGAAAQRFQDRLVLAHGLAPALTLASVS